MGGEMAKLPETTLETTGLLGTGGGGAGRDGGWAAAAVAAAVVVGERERALLAAAAVVEASRADMEVEKFPADSFLPCASFSSLMMDLIRFGSLHVGSSSLQPTSGKKKISRLQKTYCIKRSFSCICNCYLAYASGDFLTPSGVTMAGLFAWALFSSSSFTAVSSSH